MSYHIRGIKGGKGNIMKNLSISKKLIVGFGAVFVLLALSIVFSLVSMNRLGDQVELYGQYTVPNITDIWKIRRNLVSAERYVLKTFSEEEGKEIESLFAQAGEDGKEALAQLERYAANQRDMDHDMKINELRTLFSQADAVRTEMAELLQNPTEVNQQKGYELFCEQYSPLFDQATVILDDFSASADAYTAQQRAEAVEDERAAIVMLVTCAVVSLVLTIVVVFAIGKSILSPVKEIVDVFEEISKGHLQAEIKYEGCDEIGQMAELIQKTNRMQQTMVKDLIEKFKKISQGDLQIHIDIDYPGDFAALKETIEKTVSILNYTMQTINTAAEQVSTGAEQVSSGAQALAAGSTEQASSVEELTVSIAQIAEEAAENSINVKAATEYVEQVAAGVVTGNEHMKELTAAMADIGAASDQITNITKVIEDIAFQTNILALNAAIEAARAGNAGKGFAVVADEVRNLAAKSAEAAKQTADLILTSVNTVNKGTQTTTQTAQILIEVGEKAQMANDSIIKIEQASEEQAGAIEQIKQGLSQVSAVVQTNAATAEENSATSEEMSAQAVTLHEEVEKFKLSSVYRRDNDLKISLNELPKENVPKLDTALDLGKY